MFKKRLILLGGAVLLCVTLFGTAVHAQLKDPTVVRLINPIGGIDDGTEESAKGTVDIPLILGQALTSALGIMGSAALLMFVVGGVLWLTSAGNPERVKKGTQTMIWSAIGVLIIFSSYAILSLVLKGIGAQGLGGGIDPKSVAIPTASANICLCHTQDQASGVLTDALVVEAETASECEAYPSVTGQFDACGFLKVKKQSCVCEKYSADKTTIESTQVIGDVEGSTACEAYPSTSNLFDACLWIAE